MIVANAVVLGLETYPGVMAEHGSLLVGLNAVFYGVFVVELVLRFASYGRRPQDFFRSGWNVFDLVIIGAAAVPGVREQTQLLRLLRLARIVRLVRFLPDARILISDRREVGPVGLQHPGADVPAHVRVRDDRLVVVR